MARLDALNGLERASIAPRFAAPEFCAERRFASPVQTVEAIEATLRKLADDLVVLLERQAKGARRIELVLYRVDGDVRRIGVGASRPLNEARAIVRLSLGMLTALSKGFGLIDKHYGERLTLATIPPEEPHVYAMIQRADTIGVFQIESRARMSMLPWLKPAKFYDLVIEVAIVRPGPIQGDMVHPYLRRRQGLEEVVYPSQELEAVLKKTLGVPLFQEQAMKIAIVVAGFTPSEADRLRRAMATFRHVGTIQTFEDKMIEGMAAKGYDRDFAERCFRQIEGFGEYGFPESHAASFALLVSASCWMKCRYPDVFAAAMLNSQPLGFYAPAQLVRDAREHSVGVREVDVNLSDWDCTLEPPCTLHVSGSGLIRRQGRAGRPAGSDLLPLVP